MEDTGGLRKMEGLGGKLGLDGPAARTRHMGTGIHATREQDPVVAVNWPHWTTIFK